MDNLSEEQIDEFHEAFNLFDKNHDGKVKRTDVPAIFRSLGQNASKEQLDRLTGQVSR
jgi:calmodulin